MTACIVGWSHLPFGKREADDLESMIVEVARGAGVANYASILEALR